MLRQIRNLIHFGRLRTAAYTRRSGKPRFLRRHPDLEIADFTDLVTARHGRAPPEFFFVQVGAFDGRTGDPLFRLVTENGWRGILVEPQADAFVQLKENYADQPQLQFFNVAIGASDGEVTLYTRKSGAISTASMTRRLVITRRHGAGEVQARQVPCWTLATLLARAQAPEHIDLLQIDTEGHDYEIIRAIDFPRLKPTIIRYEHALLTPRDCDACLTLLAEQGYRFLLEDRDTTAVLETDRTPGSTTR